MRQSIAPGARRVLLAWFLVLARTSGAQGRPVTPDLRTLLPADTAAERRALVTREDWRMIGIVGLATAGAVALDRTVAIGQRDHPTPLLASLDNASIDNELGWVTRPGVWFIAGALYGAGRLADASDIADLGAHAAEAVAAAFVATGALKVLVGRAQPVSVGDSMPLDLKLGGGWRTFARQSFPSGETSIAFAMAAAVTNESQRVWPHATRVVAPIMFGGATAVALSRLNADHHWLSDIVFGAGLGMYVGNTVVRLSHAHPRNALDRALFATRLQACSDGAAIVVSLAQ